MGIIEGSRKVGGTALGLGSVKVAVATYDFAVHGGAIGAITLTGDAIPAGAHVIDAYVDVDTAVTSGGAATVSLGVEGAADVRAAATLATAPALSTTGPKRSALLNGSTAPVETTAARSIVATVAAATLTAGKFTVVVQFVELA